MFKILALLMILAQFSCIVNPAISFAQNAIILPKVVNEGDTSKVVVEFYDENKLPTTAKVVKFYAQQYPNYTLLQAEQSCVTGTCSGLYFDPTAPASTMKLTLHPCANRILQENGGATERTIITVIFAEPASCDLTVAGSCDWGSGKAVFTRSNTNGTKVCKGIAGTVLPTTDCTMGCPVKVTTCGANVCP